MTTVRTFKSLKIYYAIEIRSSFVLNFDILVFPVLKFKTLPLKNCAPQKFTKDVHASNATQTGE